MVRVRAFVDGYGLSDGPREEMPVLMAVHTRGMADLLADGARTRAQAWARLYAEGHFAHWTAATRPNRTQYGYVAAHA